jgi:CubicO group peptidase (beta-lactamase class C family)
MTTLPSGDPVAELAHPRRLERGLAAALDGAGRLQVFVGVRCRDRSAVAFVGDDGEAGSVRAPLIAGCLAKLLTATLVVRTLARYGDSVDAPLADLLGAAALRGESPALVRRVTVRHLLEHTHGFDDSALDRPLRSGAFLDPQALLERLCAARAIAPPGELCSYGAAGAWLAAAVAECQAGRTYAELLRAELLAPLGIELRARSPSPVGDSVCPAHGGAIALAPEDWLRFVVAATVDRAPEWPRDAGSAAAGRTITALPGWNPLERGVFLGWKYHGHGWFGHQSVWPDASAFVRANPERGVALVLFSRDHPASVVAARLFGSAFPELFDLRAPPMLARGAATDAGIRGSFGNARFRAEVVAARGGLELLLEDRVRGLRRRAALAPAAAQVFFVRAPGIDEFPYVQLIGRRGTLGYLWNGRCVLPRL